MLEIVFDRLVRLMTTSLRNFTSDNVEVSPRPHHVGLFGDYLNSIPLPARPRRIQRRGMGQFRSLTVDFSLIYSIIDVLLGGRRGTASLRIEGRPYTTIETNLVKRLVEVVLARCRTGLQALVTGDISRSTGWKPIRALPRSAALPTPPFLCGFASIWKIVAATSNCCCLMRPSNLSATCCCRCSWAKNSAAIRSGRPSCDRDRQAEITVNAVLYESDIPLEGVDAASGRRHASAQCAGGDAVVLCAAVTLFHGRCAWDVSATASPFVSPGLCANHTHDTRHV